jgi:uncharacterized membrane protein
VGLVRFETSIEIDAPQSRVWEVVSDLPAWPDRISTVELVELLTPAPLGVGSRLRLKQPKLPEGEWEVTVWDPPRSFEYRQKSAGMAVVADHRVEAVDEGRSRLSLCLDMRGVAAVVVVGLFYRGLTNRYLAAEAQGMKDAAESS